LNPEPQGARILIVDDEPGIVRAVARILGRRHQVVAAASGEAAVEEARRLALDLAIVDIGLPGMNGFEATRALKAERPGIDAILITGNAEEPDETLIRAIDEGAFYFIQKPFDRRVLLTLVNRCLELRSLREEREQFLRRVERELEEARQFQLSLLPPRRKELAGLSIAARYLACNELAGDIYDYVEVDRDRVALLIADVVGHGTSAAMMTSVVKAAFRAAHVEGFEPMAVIDRVKEGIRDFEPSRFVTMCCALLDRARGELRYVNAGHPEPIVRSGDAPLLLLDSTGPILSSALFEIPCEQAACPLGPGDSLLLYTDGVTEAHGPEGLFGQERLLSAVTSGARGGDLLDRLLSDVLSFTNTPGNKDDITLLSLDLAGPAAVSSGSPVGSLCLQDREADLRSPRIEASSREDEAPGPQPRLR
jgi:sigma-B regulation protein RsbU (phosphoserine phosphatase)